MHDKNLRIYIPSECIVFHKTREKFGELSNMNTELPLYINGILLRSLEHGYQSFKYPKSSWVQQIIIKQSSPITAKMKSREYQNNCRYDWIKVSIPIMRWLLKVKLCCNWTRFSNILLSTNNANIVEYSRNDSFWGAIKNDNKLIGYNILGRLLMELREFLKQNPTQFDIIYPLNIGDFLLLNKEINIIKRNK